MAIAMTGTWHRLVLPGSGDGLAATYALVTSGLFESYVAFANGDNRWLAGNVHGDVVVHRDGIRWRAGAEETALPLGPQPLRALGDVLAGWPLRGHRSFGYLTFELAHLLHGSARPLAADGPPLAHLVVPQVQVRWTAGETVVEGWRGDLVDAAAQVLVARPALPAFEPVAVELAPTPARRAYEEMVRAVQAAIRRGDLHKAIVSRRLDLSFPVDLPASYVLGHAHNTPARSFLLDLDGRACAGFSPETVVEVDADGAVRTQPLAGTRPLPQRPDRDERLRDELRWDVKECYEHAISARLSGEEMLGVCDPATVAVRDLMTVKRRGTVQHLASMVTGHLLPGRTAWDAAAALWPAVTASGIPKRPALDLISELEGDERGLYAGAVCTVGSDGSLDAALVLRSVYQDASGAWLRAGAGIVAASNPPDEYDETTNKLRSAAAGLVAARPTARPAGASTIHANGKEKC